MIRQALMAAARGMAGGGAPTYSGLGAGVSTGPVTGSTATNLGLALFARSATFKSTGKWYWELVEPTPIYGAGGPSTALYGMSSAAHTTGYFHSSGNGFAYYPTNNAVFGNATSVTYSGYSVPGGVSSCGGVFGFAADLDTEIIKVYYNNNLVVTFNSSLGNVGLSPTAGGDANGSHSVTVRFNPSEHTYSPPPGFTAGWPDN